MAKRINMEANHVTAGKFIEIGKDSVSLRQRLRAIGQSAASSSNSLRMEIIQSIASDNTITPEEKKSLAEEYDYIVQGFNSITSNVKSLGLEDSTQYKALKERYDELVSMIAPLLDDMDSSSAVPDGFSSIFQAFTTQANTLNSYLVYFQSGVQSKLLNYTLQVKPDIVSISQGDTCNLTAYIYLEDMNVTQSEMNKITVTDESHPYPTLFKWSFDGLKDNDKKADEALGNRSVSISFDEISGTSFNASFTSTIEVKEPDA